MSDAKARLFEDPLDLADASGLRSSVSSDDHVPTNRLSPVLPPRPARPSSYPTTPPPPGPLPSAEPKASWWRALLSATLAPPPLPSGFVEPGRGRVLARRMATGSIGIALLLPFAALAAVLWGVPSTLTPVAVTVVVARVVVALGLLSFALGLLRAAERLLAASTPARIDPDRV